MKYSGSAVVIFRRDDKLFEVHGSHCSCMGLEEQWEPEETTIEALRMRSPYNQGEASAIKYAISVLETN